MYTVKINNDYTFELADYPYFFDEGLRVRSLDLLQVKEAFSNINVIDIYNDDNLVATYTAYDSFANIGFNGSDELVVTLKKLSVEEQLYRLNEKINPTIDFETMIFEDRLEYEVNKIRKAVQEDIFNGIDVELSNGETEHFELTLEDQSNISSLYLTAITSHGLITALPYHSHGHLCREYPIEDIIRIYVAMQKFIALKTTIANFTIQRANNVMMTEEFADIYYGMEFSAEETAQINEIMSSTNATIDAMLELLNGGDNQGN